MTIKDIVVANACDKFDFTKKDAKEFFDLVFETINAELKSGNKVQVNGFGSFEVKTVKAREGRNPKTGETIKIEASKKVNFKVAKALKDEINK
jgi:DNA-binding protein HU-beta